MKAWATIVAFLLIALNAYAGPSDYYSKHHRFKAIKTTHYIKISKDGHPKALLELPRRYKEREKWPLVVNIHGYTGNIFLQYILTRLSIYKDILGFMILTPQGRTDRDGNTFWNGGNFCCDFYETGVDDTLYMKNLIDYIASHPDFNRVDTRRIYYFGHSNGGFFAYKMACAYPNYVTAVGTLGASLDLRDENGEIIVEQDPCPQASAIPIFHIHGTKDKSIPYAGKDYMPEYDFGHIGAREAVERWLYHNRCDMQGDQKRTNASLFIWGKETRVETFSNCENQATVKFATVRRGKHIELLRYRFYKKMLKFFLKYQKSSIE